MIPQVMCCTITPKSFGVWNIKFHHIPARAKVTWQCMGESKDVRYRGALPFGNTNDPICEWREYRIIGNTKEEV